MNIRDLLEGIPGVSKVTTLALSGEASIILSRWGFSYEGRSYSLCEFLLPENDDRLFVLSISCEASFVFPRALIDGIGSYFNRYAPRLFRHDNTKQIVIRKA